MQLPLQIAFRHMDRSDEIEAIVREKAAHLDSFGGDIIGCRVVIEPAGKHHRQGNHYAVRIDLTVPGEEIAVSREPAERSEHRDLRAALRDAFDSARRRLEDFVRRRRGQTKTPDGAPRARVDRLFPDQDHGFLATPDGREVYFHRHSVVDGDFDRMRLGTEVAFVEEQGEKGPQASTVRPVGRHRL